MNLDPMVINKNPATTKSATKLLIKGFIDLTNLLASLFYLGLIESFNKILINLQSTIITPNINPSAEQQGCIDSWIINTF